MRKLFLALLLCSASAWGQILPGYQKNPMTTNQFSLGSGLTLSGGVLSASGGSGTGYVFNANQFGLGNITNVALKSGVAITNGAFAGTFTGGFIYSNGVPGNNTNFVQFLPSGIGGYDITGNNAWSLVPNGLQGPNGFFSVLFGKSPSDLQMIFASTNATIPSVRWIAALNGQTNFFQIEDSTGVPRANFGTTGGLHIGNGIAVAANELVADGATRITGTLSVGGTVTLTNALPIGSGGTAASTAINARTNLGVAITNAIDVNLTTIAEGNALIWNAGIKQFTNGTITGGAGNTFNPNQFDTSGTIDLLSGFLGTNAALFGLTTNNGALDVAGPFVSHTPATNRSTLRVMGAQTNDSTLQVAGAQTNQAAVNVAGAFNTFATVTNWSTVRNKAGVTNDANTLTSGAVTNASSEDVAGAFNTFSAVTNWSTVRNKGNVTNDAVVQVTGNQTNVATLDVTGPFVSHLASTNRGTVRTMGGQTNDSNLRVVGAAEFQSTVTNSAAINNAKILTNWSGQVDQSLTASRAVVTDANKQLVSATGVPDGTKFLRDDGTYAVPPGTGGNTFNPNQFDVAGTIDLLSGLLITNTALFGLSTNNGTLDVAGPFVAHTAATNRSTLRVMGGQTNDSNLLVVGAAEFRSTETNSSWMNIAGGVTNYSTLNQVGLQTNQGTFDVTGPLVSYLATTNRGTVRTMGGQTNDANFRVVGAVELQSTLTNSGAANFGASATNWGTMNARRTLAFTTYLLTNALFDGSLAQWQYTNIASDVAVTVTNLSPGIRYTLSVSNPGTFSVTFANLGANDWITHPGTVGGTVTNGITEYVFWKDPSGLNQTNIIDLLQDTVYVPGANVTFTTNTQSKITIASSGSGGSSTGYVFNANQFGANNVSNISILSGALLTNIVMAGSNVTSGTIGVTPRLLPSSVFDGTNAAFYTNISANLTVTVQNIFPGVSYSLLVSNPGVSTVSFTGISDWPYNPANAASVATTNGVTEYMIWRDHNGKTNALSLGQPIVFAPGANVTFTTNTQSQVTIASTGGGGNTFNPNQFDSTGTIDLLSGLLLTNALNYGVTNALYVNNGGAVTNFSTTRNIGGVTNDSNVRISGSLEAIGSVTNSSWETTAGGVTNYSTQMQVGLQTNQGTLDVTGPLVSHVASTNRGTLRNMGNVTNDAIVQVTGNQTNVATLDVTGPFVSHIASTNRGTVRTMGGQTNDANFRVVGAVEFQSTLTNTAAANFGGVTTNWGAWTAQKTVALVPTLLTNVLFDGSLSQWEYTNIAQNITVTVTNISPGVQYTLSVSNPGIFTVTFANLGVNDWITHPGVAGVATTNGMTDFVFWKDPSGLSKTNIIDIGVPISFKASASVVMTTNSQTSITLSSPSIANTNGVGTNATLYAISTTTPLILQGLNAVHATNMLNGAPSAGNILGGFKSNMVAFISPSNSTLTFPANYTLFQMTGDGSVTNTTTTTNTIWGTGNGSRTITNGFWDVGRSIVTTFDGQYWTGTTPGNCRLLVMLTTTAATNTLDSKLFTPTASITADSYYGDFRLTCRTNSATVGALELTGKLITISAGTATWRNFTNSLFIGDTISTAYTLEISFTNGASTDSWQTKNGAMILQ